MQSVNEAGVENAKRQEDSLTRAGQDFRAQTQVLAGQLDHVRSQLTRTASERVGHECSWKKAKGQPHKTGEGA